MSNTRPPRPHAVKIGTAVYAITVDGRRHNLNRLDLTALDQPVLIDRDTRAIAVHPDLHDELATFAVFAALVEICDGEADRMLDALRDNAALVDWLLAA